LDFFIQRPIFAAAIALIVLLAGTVCAFTLPISRYPPVVPPQVEVSTQYIGASAEVVADTVTTPLEEQLNGAEGMIYMSSNSTNNGNSIIKMTFDVGYDQSIAQMEALTRANQALSQLPSDVTQVGVTITKQSSDNVLVVSLTSPGGTHDQIFLQNFAVIHITDRLARIPGVATVTIFGLRQYAMRIWLDAAKLGNLGLTGTDVANAVREQNKQVAAGKLAAAPAPQDHAFEYQLVTHGRLKTVEEFENIVIRANPDGSTVRVGDIARVELGADSYSGTTGVSGKPAANIAVYQLPNANALEIARSVRAAMRDFEPHFPEDMKWSIFFDTTAFIKASTREVLITLLQTVALVVLVVFVFLQDLRGTLIPTVAIPVSVAGALAFMLLLGFSINMLTLLGLVVAVTLVVDDAIVVVENVNRHLALGARDIRRAVSRAMAEVRGPVIATTLVLLAVFVPIAFIPGMTGQLYKQFALTIAISVAISGLVSLSLSPALCTVLLRPGRASGKGAFFRLFNKTFDTVTNAYAASVGLLVRYWYVVLIVFGGLCALTWSLFKVVPTAFVPAEDQGYVLIAAQLPAAATAERSLQVARQINDIVTATPGIAHVVEVTGFDLTAGIELPYANFAIPVLAPWDQRRTPETQIGAIIQRLQTQLAGIPGARIRVFNAASVPGLGSTGGFNFEIQDLNGLGVERLGAVTDAFIDAAQKRPELKNVSTTFDPNVPQRLIAVDRVKAKTRGVPLDDIFDTLQINLGSLYVNQFNKFGRLYRVYLQADASQRTSEADLLRLQVRNSAGQMIPLSAIVKLSPIVGPYNIAHYNEYASVQVNGSTAPGYGSGQAIAAMEEVAAANLPEGFHYQWTDLVYQQKKVGNLAPLVFALSLVFVFLVLAAMYESWLMPVVILLTVPLGLLGAVGALMARGMDLDVYGQIGLIMLIGLVAKNAILIVGFAKERRISGANIVDAATEAARMRLRPILMTALAFIVGLLPLVVASGAGAGARQSLGTAVVGGLALATVLIIFVPTFYCLAERLKERIRGSEARVTGSEAGTGRE
jgi:HAE1 family hydrophobic/amphiphilic exporter-1